MFAEIFRSQTDCGTRALSGKSRQMAEGLSTPTLITRGRPAACPASKSAFFLLPVSFR